MQGKHVSRRYLRRKRKRQRLLCVGGVAIIAGSLLGVPVGKVLKPQVNYPIVESTTTVCPERRDSEAEAAQAKELTVTTAAPVVYTFDYRYTPGTLLTMSTVRAWHDEVISYKDDPNLTPETLKNIEIWDTVFTNIEHDVVYTNAAGETLPVMLAKIVTQEIGGLTDAISYSTARMEQSGVVWCILNRADNQGGTASDVVKVAKSPHQFAYCATVVPFKGIEALCTDVLIRWQLEKGYTQQGKTTEEAATLAGRTLASNYTFFSGDSKHNHFRTEFSLNSTRWDWHYTDPYKG